MSSGVSVQGSIQVGTVISEFIRSRCLEKNRVYQNEKTRALRAVVLSHYGNCCGFCGESIVEFLTIDHVNDDGCLHRTRAGNRVRNCGLYREIIESGFSDRFQVLCFNCNCSKQIVGLEALLEVLR